MQINTRKRSELKQYFVRNAIPTESNFTDLIDGTLNMRDDGVVKVPGQPLSVQAENGPVFGLYESFDEDQPRWVVGLQSSYDADSPPARPGLSFHRPGQHSSLFIDDGTGYVGVGVTNPQQRLAVDGYIAAKAVYFSAYLIDHNLSGEYTRRSSAFPLRGVVQNVGDGYDREKSLFTVPVHGVYLFSITAFNNSNSQGSLFLMHNDNYANSVLSNAATLVRFAGQGLWQTNSRSILIEAKIGDQIWLSKQHECVFGIHQTSLDGILIQAL